MTTAEVIEYRSELSSHLAEKEKEIDTNIDNINIALLGFFIVVNEKFIPLLTSDAKILMYLSVGGFVISFVISLFYKMFVTFYDKKLIKFLDTHDLSLIVNENLLLRKHAKFSTVLTWLKGFVYIFMGCGLIFQLSYLYINLNKTDEKNIVVNFKDTKSLNDTTMTKKDFIIHIKRKYSVNGSKAQNEERVNPTQNKSQSPKIGIHQ